MKFLLLLLCLQAIDNHAFGQIKYSFTKDTLEIKGGETFSNLLKITNSYSETVILRQDSKENELYRGLITLPDSMIISAGESKVFPLKYIADRQTINSNIQVFTVNLVSKDVAVKVQKSARFMAQLSNIGGLTIGTEEDEIYLSQLSNQVQVMVRVANNSFVPLTFRLVLSGIPDGLEFTGQTTDLTIQPGSQQLLPFLARNKEGLRSSADFTVTIQAMDGRNHQLAVKILRIVRVTSARSLGRGVDQFGGAPPNTIGIRYGSLNSNSSFYQLQSNGKMKTGEKQQLEYRLNVDQYHQSEGSSINIYNTYVDYQAKSWGLKVGNIYENIDYSLSGRGIKASVKVKETGALSIYGIQNNYLLYDQLNRTIQGAKIYALDYDLIDPVKGERRLTLLNSHDPVTGIDANQFSMKTGFKWKDGQILGLEAGASLEDRNLSSTKMGGSAGINYAMSKEDYQLYGNGYYSSPYFTGLRRGLFLTDIRFTRKLSEFNSLVAHVSLQISNPKYQDSLNSIFTRGINKNAIYTYEIGYNIRFGNFNMGFNPYFMEQHLMASSLQEILPVYIDWTSSSLRFAASLGYNGRIHSFSVTADYGYTYLNSSGKPPAPFHSIKINTSYNMPVFGFSSYIQINPFYLSDAFSSTGTNRYRLYSFGPNIHFSAFKNKLNLQTGGMYNYYGFTNSNGYSLNGNLRYLMKGHWTLTGDLLYMVTKQDIVTLPYDPLNATAGNTDNFQFNNRQLRIGIEKQFGRQSKGSKKLELTYYEDHNSNGRRDEGESLIPGVLVKINGEAALTNSKGIVEFKDMKKEAYTVSITNTRGWSLPEPTAVFLDKNKRMEIPLVKTQALNGCLKPVIIKYVDSKPALAGIRINAMDLNGRIYQTLTDDQGKFCFYLPRNEYTVYIETKGMQFSIENDKEQVSLKGLPVGILTFLYKDEARKIGVTRF